MSQSNIPSNNLLQNIEHTIWDDLLRKYVAADGNVNYQGFIEEKTSFDQYLSLLSNNPPNEKIWSESERLAYWINVYNAFTVKMIVDHYPVASIRDIKKGIPFINSIWEKKFFQIGGKEMSLGEVEHKIIRRRFDEPRIHFAVNCASYSCPRLRNEAYTADKLETQLDDQTRKFLLDTRKNNINHPDKIQISKIFSWYGPDFTDKGFFSRIFGKGNRNKKLINFISTYSGVAIDEDAKVAFLEYNWSLNEQVVQ